MKKRLLALLTVLVLVVGVSTNVLADPFTPIIPASAPIPIVPIATPASPTGPIIPFSTSIDVYAVDM